MGLQPGKFQSAVIISAWLRRRWQMPISLRGTLLFGLFFGGTACILGAIIGTNFWTVLPACLAGIILLVIFALVTLTAHAARSWLASRSHKNQREGPASREVPEMRSDAHDSSNPDD